MKEIDFVHIIQKAHGEVYIVGGWVRDNLANRPPKDKDYVLCHLAEKTFIKLFPHAEKVGKSFPVYLLTIDGKKCEIAFARKERKIATGYKGFQAITHPEISITDDLARRDTRMNSIALRLPQKQLIDPYDGQNDIKAQRIDATSHHFSEDPIRALRAARQAAELNFSITDYTIQQMRACQKELALEPAERVFNEIKKVLSTPSPSRFFSYLLQADLLTTAFPEIAKAQNQYPEHFSHTLTILD